MPKNASDVARKWANNLTNATQSMVEGANAVTESPTAKAAQSAEKYVAGVQRSVEKWQSGLNRVTLNDWKRAYISKGVPRIAQGAQESMPKMETFLRDFLPYAEQVSNQVKQMPSATLEQNIQRMVTAVRLMSQYKRK